MTKKTKTLNWKLKELPTAEAVAELVAQEIITPEEGREILFGSREYDYEKMKALEEQVAFLQDLVKELAKKNTTTIWTGYSYSKPVRYYDTPYWGKTYEVLCDAGLKLDTNTIESTAGSTFVNTASSIDSNKLVGKSPSVIMSVSNIKTDGTVS